MPLENRRDNLAGSAPVYTVYPGGAQKNVNYGFRYGHPQGPPPNYEDVVGGNLSTEEQRPPLQLSGPYQGAQHSGVVFVAPVYKYSRRQKTLAGVLTLVFVIFFVSVLIKALNFR